MQHRAPSPRLEPGQHSVDRVTPVWNDDRGAWTMKWSARLKGGRLLAGKRAPGATKAQVRQRAREAAEELRQTGGMRGAWKGASGLADDIAQVSTASTSRLGLVRTRTAEVAVSRSPVSSGSPRVSICSRSAVAVFSSGKLLPALGVAAGAALLLAGCGQLDPGACSTVGYRHTLTVHIEDDSQAVEKVLVCGGGRCADDLASTTDLNTVNAEHSSQEAAAWTATLSYAEEPLLIQLIGSDGSVLKEALVEPDWRLTGGSERCGGPAAAEVTLSQ